MPKMKTHSGAKKRLRINKNGVIKGAHSGRRKKLINKSAKRKRNLRKKMLIHDHDLARITPLLRTK